MLSKVMLRSMLIAFNVIHALSFILQESKKPVTTTTEKVSLPYAHPGAETESERRKKCLFRPGKCDMDFLSIVKLITHLFKGDGS
jgi:hypothetical protein